MNQKLKDIYGKCFDASGKSLGESEYKSNKIIDCFKTEAGYFASIKNNIYKVRIYTDLAKNALECTCSSEKNCYHVYALILAIDDGKFTELNLNDSTYDQDDVNRIKEIVQHLNNNKKKEALNLIPGVINLNYFYNGQTLLNKACECGILSIIKTLIEKGADINVQYDKESNLKYAINNARKTENYEILDYLLRQGADLNNYSQNGYFFEEINYTDIAVLKYLIRKGYNIKDEPKLPELFKDCCRRGELELVNQIIEKGIDINKSYSAGRYKYTFLCDALQAEKNQYSIVESLLKHGFNIKTCADINEDVLSLAYKCKDEKVVELIKTFLESNGIDINKTIINKTDMRMQIIAVEYANSNMELVLEALNLLTPKDIIISSNAWETSPSMLAYKELLEHIGNRKDKNTLIMLIEKVKLYNLETLVAAVHVHDFDLFKEIAAKHGKIKYNAMYFETQQLMRAVAEEDDDKALEYLYENGITIKKVEYLLDTLIDAIIEKDSKKILNHLLNYYDKNVLKELIIAFIKNNRDDLVEYLLNSEHKDFYINIKDNNNYLTEYLIYKPACLKLFIPFMNHFNESQKDELLLKTLWAMKSYYEPKSIEVIREIINLGASVNAIEKNTVTTSGTALYFAASGPNDEVVKYLIENGADINKSIELGFNPLQAALISKYDDTVEYFHTVGMKIEDYLDDPKFKYAYDLYLMYQKYEEEHNPKKKKNNEKKNEVYKFKIYIEGFQDTVYRIIELDGSLPAGFLIQTIYQVVGIKPEQPSIIDSHYYYEPHDYQKWYEEVLYKKFYIKDLDLKINQKISVDQMEIYETADSYDSDSESLMMILEVIEISSDYKNPNLIFLDSKSDNMNEFISKFDDNGNYYLTFDSPDNRDINIDINNLDDINTTLNFARKILENYEDKKIKISFSEKDPNQTAIDDKENIYNYLLNLDDKTLEKNGYLNKQELTKVDQEILNYIVTYGRVINVDEIVEYDEYYED